MKVAELTGNLLSYWFFRAQGRNHERAAAAVCGSRCHTCGQWWGPAIVVNTWSYTKDALEAEKISLQPNASALKEFQWRADWNSPSGPAKNSSDYVGAFYGPDPDTAIMRCFIACKLGEEVSDVELDGPVWFGTDIDRASLI